jgi:hypothetical protein
VDATIYKIFLTFPSYHYTTRDGVMFKDLASKNVHLGTKAGGKTSQPSANDDYLIVYPDLL